MNSSVWVYINEGLWKGVVELVEERPGRRLGSSPTRWALSICRDSVKLQTSVSQRVRDPRARIGVKICRSGLIRLCLNIRNTYRHLPMRLDSLLLTLSLLSFSHSRRFVYAIAFSRFTQQKTEISSAQELFKNASLWKTQMKWIKIKWRQDILAGRKST